MNTYEWILKDTNTVIDEGTLNAQDDTEAKRKTTAASGTAHWKKRWHRENKVFLKYNGDARKRFGRSFDWDYRGPTHTLELRLKGASDARITDTGPEGSDG